MATTEGERLDAPIKGLLGVSRVASRGRI